MSEVTRTAGAAGTFTVTFNQAPVETPTVTIYSDAARTTVATATADITATANPAVWTADYPATLDAGTYYLAFSAVYTLGQPAVLDQNNTLVLEAASATVGTLPSLAEVREHLNIPDTVHDGELQGFLNTAVELIAHEIGEVAADLDVTGRPALKTAIVELVRDIWTGTQTGGATVGGAVDEGEAAGGVFGLGRPALPPYVRSLLAPYLPPQVSPVQDFAGSMPYVR